MNTAFFGRLLFSGEKARSLQSVDSEGQCLPEDSPQEDTESSKATFTKLNRPKTCKNLIRVCIL